MRNLFDCLFHQPDVHRGEDIWDANPPLTGYRSVINDDSNDASKKGCLDKKKRRVAMAATPVVVTGLLLLYFLGLRKGADNTLLPAKESTGTPSQLDSISSSFSHEMTISAASLTHLKSLSEKLSATRSMRRTSTDDVSASSRVTFSETDRLTATRQKSKTKSRKKSISASIEDSKTQRKNSTGTAEQTQTREMLGTASSQKTQTENQLSSISGGMSVSDTQAATASRGLSETLTTYYAALRVLLNGTENGVVIFPTTTLFQSMPIPCNDTGLINKASHFLAGFFGDRSPNANETQQNATAKALAEEILNTCDEMGRCDGALQYAEVNPEYVAYQDEKGNNMTYQSITEIGCGLTP